MKVNIDGYDYQLAAGEKITRQPIMEFPQHLRTTGQQRREDRSLISSWWQEDFDKGFGTSKIVNVSSDRQMSSFWDSEVNTVFPGQVTLPALRFQATYDIAATWGAFSATEYFPPNYVFEHEGTIYSFKGKSSKILMSSLQVDANGNAEWASFSTFDGTFNALSKNLLNYQGNNVFMSGIGSSSGGYFIRFFKLVPTPKWLEATVQIGSDYGGMNVFNMMKNKREAWWTNGDVATPRLLRYNWERGEFKYKDNPDNGILALFPFTGRDGLEGMHAAYKNRLSCFESSGEVGSYYIPQEVTYLDFTGQGAEENAAASVEWNKAIQFPMDESLVSYYRDGTVTEIGMDLFSGMPASKKGSITDTLPTLRRLFAKVPVETNKSYVFQNDTTAWHYFGNIPIGSTKTDMLMGNITEGSPAVTKSALHLVSLNPAATFYHYYWKYPIDNPLTTEYYQFEATGHLTLPQFDGGIPNEQSNMFKQTLDLDQYPGTTYGIGHIYPNYGIDGATPSSSASTEEQTDHTSKAIKMYSGGAERVGQLMTINDRNLMKLSFFVYKGGNPTGDVTFTIRKFSDDSIIGSKVFGDASSIVSDDWNEASLPFTAINEKVRICIEFSGGDSSNYLAPYYISPSAKSNEFFVYYTSGAWDDTATNYDLAYKYEYLPFSFKATGLNKMDLGGTTGEVGIRYQPRFEFHRAATAYSTPVMYSGVMEYLKLPDIRETFAMTLDLTRTATDGTVALATLANNLYNLRDNKHFIPLYYYEGTVQSDVFKVRAVEMPTTELTPEHADSYYRYNRQLVVKVAFAELAG